MKSLVLDSNAIIALFDGDEKIREIISSAEKVRVPAVVLGEVKLGINGTKRGHATQKALERFLDLPFVEVLNVGTETADCFVTIMKYLMEHRTRSRPTTSGSPPVLSKPARFSSPATPTSPPSRWSAPPADEHPCTG